MEAERDKDTDTDTTDSDDTTADGHNRGLKTDQAKGT